MSTQLTLYSDALGPNGWKVAMILNELGVTYKTVMVDVFQSGEGSMSKTEFMETINPNGRIPAIVDHTANDFTLWESVAIIQYVTRKFDTEHKLSYTDMSKSALLDQWLLFQASGQGPYFGQLTWFIFYHPEKNIDSVITRYRDEVRRVNGVLESVLRKNGGFLVGDKLTVADLSFVIWTDVIAYWTPAMGPDFQFGKEFPAVNEWYERMMKLPGVDSVRQEREDARTRRK